MKDVIIEIFGKRVRIVEDEGKSDCGKCTFKTLVQGNYVCSISSGYPNFKAACSSFDLRKNQHFEEVS